MPPGVAAPQGYGNSPALACARLGRLPKLRANRAAGGVAVASTGMADLRGRSIRTLAWLGDAEFEREVRYRIARRGDYPSDRLDAMKTRVVRAEAQAALLEGLLPGLAPPELDLVRRGRNSTPPAAARGGRRRMQEYRAATALEALVATWCLGGDAGRQRMQAVLGPALDAAIDHAVEVESRRPRRG